MISEGEVVAKRASEMSAAEQGSRAILWTLRGLVVGTSILAIGHVYPIARKSWLENAVPLAGSDYALFAREGARRLKRQALKSKSRREELLSGDAMKILGKRTAGHVDVSVRHAALDAICVIIHDVGHGSDERRDGAAHVLRFKDVASALVDDDCQAECQALWKVVVGQERPESRERRIEMLCDIAKSHNESVTRQ